MQPTKTENIKKNYKRVFWESLKYLAGFVIVFYLVDGWRGRHLPQGEVPKAVYLDIDGQSLDIAQQSEGEVVVVYFWATWCGPCKVTSPSVSQLAKQAKVISIATRSDEDTALIKYIQSKEYHYAHTVNDFSGAIAREWGMQVTPTILFIKNGRVVDFTTGVSTYPGLMIRHFWVSNKPW